MSDLSSPPESLEADRSARQQALDPETSFIVQAPAGSGKTELLTQRYLRLLATVDHPEQVLAITFTRKAAAEMRNRILLALESARQPAPQSAHKRQTWELASAVQRRDAHHDWQLLQHPARLRIQTIDALNSMLARRLPVLSGTGAALEPSSDPGPLYEAACGRLLEHLGENSPQAQALENLIVHLGNRLDRLVTLLTELLARRDQWLHQIVRARNTSDLRQTLERTLSGIIDSHLQRLCTLMPKWQRTQMWELTRFAAGNLLLEPDLNSSRRQLLHACLGDEDGPGEGNRCLTAWREVINAFFTQDGRPRKRITKTEGFPTTDAATKARMQEALRSLVENATLCEHLLAVMKLPGAVYTEAQWQILESLLEVLPLAVAELQVVFQTRGEADYVEAALRALQALGTSDEPTDLALVFDYRLRHILIDEFQDTSFAQLDLLERLTAGWMPGDGRTLFCVGDPMQSIYRFRQAEVGLFLQLQLDGLRNVPLTPLTLRANFRSSERVVRWINKVFPAVLAPHDDASLGAVRYSASVAARPDQPRGVQIHTLFSRDEQDEAQHVVDIVKQALTADEEGTVAVLVSARSHVGSIGVELHRAGISFRAVEIEALSERPVVQDLIALTRALVHLGDRTAWLAVLRAPWCGATLHDLHSLCEPQPDATIARLLELLVDPGDAALLLDNEGRTRLIRAAIVLRTALAERGRYRLRDWVERTWNSFGGPATLATAQDLEDAQSYLARLSAIERAGDIEDIARLESQLDNLFARPRADDRARVDVMTIHKAKGLEFDTVILPTLHRGVRREASSLLRWTRMPGSRGGIVLAPMKAQGVNQDATYDWIGLLEEQRSQRERGRLLYVAATRAKRELHLLGAAEIKDNSGTAELRNPRRGSMLAMLWHELGPHYVAALQSVTASTTQNAATDVGLLLRRLPLEWQPRIAQSELASARAIEFIKPPPFDWVSETSRHVGTLVHRELDRMSRRGVPHTMTSVLQNSRRRLSIELAELGVPAERCEAAVARVIEAIRSTLADPRGRWLMGLEEPLTAIESELSLSGIVDARIVNVAIDRTFVAADGTRWIVDFKTSAHEGGGLERFLSEEVERYRLQLTRYTQLMRLLNPGETVKAALYFPLLQAWREVECA